MFYLLDKTTEQTTSIVHWQKEKRGRKMVRCVLVLVVRESLDNYVHTYNNLPIEQPFIRQSSLAEDSIVLSFLFIFIFRMSRSRARKKQQHLQHLLK
jgi:hypothetical protein